MDENINLQEELDREYSFGLFFDPLGLPRFIFPGF